MTLMRVSELAERSGVPASTLRYYDAQGLLHADRSPAGYRLFAEATVDRLAFIATAKRLGLGLGEIADLMAVWDQGSCARVRADLRPRVDAGIARARARGAELAAFAGRLDRARAHLAGPDPDGPCDPSCAFLHAPAAAGAAGDAAGGAARRPLPLADPGGPAVACALDADGREERRAEWRRALEGAVRSPGEEGMRLELPGGADAAELARLVAAERACCAFLTFDLHLGERTILEVRAPAHARALLDEFFADHS